MDPDRLTWLASALAFIFAMSATPGPNNAMITASGANWGFRRTVPHMIGVTLGFPAMLLAVAAGAGELLRTHRWAHEALRWVGAAYMLWLAFKIATAQPAARQTTSAGRPFTLLQAALFQWINPKAWVIAVSAVVTYTSGAGGSLLAQAAVLAGIFFLVTLPLLAFWTLVGVGAARVFQTERALRRFNLVMAGLLVLSLIPLFLEDIG